jgi:hypothetical protein
LLWALAVLGGYAFLLLNPKRPQGAVWAGVLLTLEWHLVWAAGSGMETLLFTFLVSLALVWLVRIVDAGATAPVKEWLGLGFVIGLGVWVRPEAVTLLGPVGLGWLSKKLTGRDRLRVVCSILLGFSFPFLLYLTFNHMLAGTWWPNTFYAKQAEYAILRETPLWQRLGQQFSLPLVGAGMLLLPGFFLFIWEALRRRAWGALSGGIWVLGHLSLYALRMPVVYQHGRYVIPVMAVYFLWSAAGMAAWLQPASRRMLRRLVSRAWLASTALVLLAFWVIGARTYARDVAIIESEMVVTARWAAENIPDSDLVAAHDIGALGYFSGRRLLDLAGLVTPDVIPFIRDESRLAEYLDEHEAAYLVTFPGWYPELVQRGTVVFESGGEVSPEMGGENMRIYRWESP